MNLLELFVAINLNKKSFEDGAKSVEQESTGLAERMRKGLGDAAIAVGKSFVAMGSVAAGAIGALSKSAITAYADYEQLTGGVETLFKESADKVMGYADVAYQTAGLSANEYMETVTGFSASLLQSLGNDTEAAADKANMAIIDMSDNANKMGTSMQSIQNAYSGFAKQNYTMLDNLKLGYGGTKEEMERLLEDANALNAAQGIYTEYSIDSYADIIDAIHVVQTEIGITGTTSLEASTTISGSIGQAKAAWQNFLTGLADENADFDALTDNLVNSVFTVVDNLVPVIMRTIPKVVSGLSEVAKKIGPYIPELMAMILPQLIEGAYQIVIGLGEALPDIVDAIFPGAMDEVGGILTDLFGPIIEGFMTSFDAITGAFQSTSIDWEGILAIIQQAFGMAAEGIGTVLGTIGPAIALVMPMISDLINYFIALAQIILTSHTPVMTALGGVWEGLFTKAQAYFPQIWEIVKKVFDSIIDIWQNHLQPCFEAIGTFITEVLGPTFQTVFDAIAPYVIGAFDLIIAAWDTILKPILTGIIDFLTDVFKGDWEAAWQDLIDIFGEIWDGIKDYVAPPINAVIGFINSMIDGVCTGINALIDALNTIQIDTPDWVEDLTGISGFGFDLDNVTAPQIPLIEYKKGYSAGYLLSSPTIFGAMNGSMLQGGDGSGNELVVGEDYFQERLNIAMDGAFNQLLGVAEAILDETKKPTDLTYNKREFGRLVRAVEG